MWKRKKNTNLFLSLPPPLDSIIMMMLSLMAIGLADHWAFFQGRLFCLERIEPGCFNVLTNSIAIQVAGMAYKRQETNDLHCKVQMQQKDAAEVFDFLKEKQLEVAAPALLFGQLKWTLQGAKKEESTVFPPQHLQRNQSRKIRMVKSEALLGSRRECNGLSPIWLSPQ